jgi:hypothetical protein
MQDRARYPFEIIHADAPVVPDLCLHGYCYASGGLTSQARPRKCTYAQQLPVPASLYLLIIQARLREWPTGIMQTYNDSIHQYSAPLRRQPNKLVFVAVPV